MNKKIDLSTKKTEAEWQRAWDQFWCKATPRWFQWLEWVTILGVVQLAARKTGLALAKPIVALSYLALWMHLQSFFFSIEWQGLPVVTTSRLRRALSLALSATLAAIVALILTELTQQLAL